MTPYLGFTYDINPAWTAYGSWTSIYKPQLVQDAGGN
nr:TonB-dependent receptor [Paracoccus litorisediminis]